MSRRFAHLSKEELEKIRDTPILNTVQSSRNAGATHESTTHTLANNPAVDQIEAVAELDERRIRRSIHLTLFVGFLAMIFAGIASWPVIREWFQASRPDSSKPVIQSSQSGSWQYSVRLGDMREQVHKLLGPASRTTPMLEEYAPSGVTAWFDNENRVTKLNFAGRASAVYATASFGPIISDRQVLFGLTGYTDEAGFRRVLGVPVKESQERSASVGELRCIWKKDGYVVDALFLAAERNYKGKIFSKGTLVWFDVFRAL
jgi:hypothetical protein